MGAWYPEHMRQKTREILSKPGVFRGPIELHRLFLNTLGSNGEEDIEDWMFEGPVMIVVPSHPAASADQYEETTREWAPDLTVVRLDMGFWGHLEKRDETNKAIEDFLNRIEESSE